MQRGRKRLPPCLVPDLHVDNGIEMLDEYNTDRLKEMKNPADNVDFYLILGATDRR